MEERIPAMEVSMGGWVIQTVSQSRQAPAPLHNLNHHIITGTTRDVPD